MSVRPSSPGLIGPVTVMMCPSAALVVVAQPLSAALAANAVEVMNSRRSWAFNMVLWHRIQAETVLVKFKPLQPVEGEFIHTPPPQRHTARAPHQANTKTSSELLSENFLRRVGLNTNEVRNRSPLGSVKVRRVLLDPRLRSPLSQLQEAWMSIKPFSVRLDDSLAISSSDVRRNVRPLPSAVRLADTRSG